MENEKKYKGDKDMLAVQKDNRVVAINNEKFDSFRKKNNKAHNAIKRFEAHQPKKGISVQGKRIDV